MEGTCCAQDGCRLHDFLPFLCPRCQRSFCLDHRSRFVHTCVPDEVKVANGEESDRSSVKQMMADVESRHDDLVGAGSSSSSHGFAIKSSAPQAGPSTGQQATSRRLAEVKGKDSALARQTACMLVRRRARGPADLLAEHRLHLTVYAQGQGQGHGEPLDYLYCARYAALGEVLRDWAPALIPRLPDSGDLGSGDLALTLCTADSPDWRAWDRSAAVGGLVGDCEDVFVGALPTTEVVAAQRALLAATTPSQLTKGCLAWYHRSAPEEVPSPRALVRVVAVHLDDFPNVYYTISRIRDHPQHPLHLIGSGDRSAVDFNGERQTDGNRLIACSHTLSHNVSPSPAAPVPVSAAAPPSPSPSVSGARAEAEAALLVGPGPPFALTVQFKKTAFALTCHPDTPLLALKQAVAVRCGLPSAAAVKLIHKGSTLKADRSTLRDCRLGPQARVLVMG